jgi:signal transduction histidine kinase
MGSDGNGKKKPEREKTDESLRSERAESDRELLDRQANVELQADEVIHRARETADAVMVVARGKADKKLEQGAGRSSTITQEREREDEALRDERASADAILRRERAQTARALSRLLPLERDQTDRFLLTERARSDDALANRDDFLGIVSHDLRNLLGGIVMSAGLIADRAAKGDGASLADTIRIERYAARMNRLIGDLVDVASIDAGKLAAAPASGDTTALLTEAVDLFQAAASAKGIALTVETQEALPARFDHDRILQVLANLITNSIKFTPRGGTISVRGERAADQVALSVTDSGAGIPPTMLERVFERFWQVGQNDRRGLGLGLYISRCIVEAHGGKISARSEPGAGSTFTFSLPV